MLFFTKRLEFICESSLSLASSRCDRHPIYLILPSFGIVPRVSTALHLHVEQINNITRPIAIYNDTCKFVAYPYNILQEFTVDSKVSYESR